MSNALAIAAVTETLVNLLSGNLDAAQVSGATVTNYAPDDSSKMPNPGVNIFLYQITPNSAYRNADLPTRGGDGTLLRKPQVALDLHYLFTFYGDDSKLEQQRLLGATALALHANPVLSRSLIQQSQSNATFLASSNLDSQAELIRVTPVVFSLEELSKLWSFLLKIDYVLSTAYVASVVLIETDDVTPAAALPVLGFNLGALPIRQPVINQISASPNASAPITANSTIALTGLNLAAAAGSVTQVLLSGNAQTPLSATATQITVALPSGLAAGIQTVQVQQAELLGSPPVLHPGAGVTSSVAAFVLLPTISPSSPPGGYALSVTTNTASPPQTVLNVGINPTVQASQRVVLKLLSQTSPPSVRLVDGGTLTTASATVSFTLSGVAAGNYFVQVIVDGAESPLTAASGVTGLPTVSL